MLGEYLFLVAVGLLLVWGVVRSVRGISSLEQAEDFAEGLRNDTFKKRVERTPKEFFTEFYSDSGIPFEAIERVLKEFEWQFGRETRKMEPSDSVADFYPGLDMADLAFRITKICGCRWKGLKAINCRIETVDDFVQLAARLMFPNPSPKPG